MLSKSIKFSSYTRRILRFWVNSYILVPIFWPEIFRRKKEMSRFAL